ncbi:MULTISPECIES: pseudouridine synthase [unclassified Thermoanaerobacterium]|uniref:pseudouridine synthase n=1 Tax=unclassified Thermoanaerobacterium TaxID=2622527 RepID=UPI000A152DDD|nr:MULTISPECIES: pseudouridine synthase [unclassified Thermoanaerobacterium]MDE4541736.1 rRNA pseudouridine synthase [Thermoanaerobacterium sp. R66]ORX24144.1 pseudouridine synthase [Thermoanaerobacterium sp. PSU-2]HHV73695.1 rRNA pseudouridine synthase [Thermoanaerobacterium sp.]
MERLQKYLAECGIASRRKCEQLILDGKVKVNGKTIRELGVKVDPNKDVVEYNGKVVTKVNKNIYIMLNKPVGYITTVKDQFDRPSVIDLVNIDDRIYPIGRLDYDTSGLLLLTNDGDLANKLMHPRHKINKVYIAQIKGVPDKMKLDMFRNGLYIDNYKTAKAEIDILKVTNGNSTVRIVIHEGRNRQIRKMCELIGHPVLKLKRVKIGNLDIGNLKTGQWRYLSKDEVEYLKKL